MTQPQLPASYSSHYTFDDDDGSDNDEDEEGQPLYFDDNYPSDDESRPPSPSIPLLRAPASSEHPGAPASWRTLPDKDQLIVLALCRFSEPLTNTSLLSYLFYLLKSFHDPPLPSATISRQAGIMASSFALAQCVTGMWWGRLSDRIGRKPCILLGLMGACVSVIGFAFSESFATALMFRTLAGCLNGNIGVLRTIMSETVKEKKHQARAFLILPMCFNIGIIVGPALGGLLADPEENYPGLFAGVGWMKRWPYALPSLVSAVFLMISWVLGFLFLAETLDSMKDRRDVGRDMGRALTRIILRRPVERKQPIDTEQTAPLINLRPTLVSRPKAAPWRKVLSRNILTTLVSQALLPLHNATFMNLYIIFLSTPRAETKERFPHVSGGLGLPAHTVGLALTILGVLGIGMQIFIYPPLQARLGLLRSFRISCCFFPVAYMLIPILNFIPSSSPPPQPAAGMLVWIGVTTVMAVQVVGRTFALPGSVILVTNSVEDSHIMGTVQGLASSLSAASRASGPVLGALAYARGLEVGMGAAVFWGMASVAGLGAGWGLLVREGKGIGK